jgi:type I restriction enzyme S subunit
MDNRNHLGWKECKLGDVVELVGGGTPKTTVLDYWNGDIPWLSVVDFNTGNKYVFNTEKTITKKGLENSSTKMLNEGDIIISARGTVGALAVLKKKMAFNQSCYGIRNIIDISDQDYLYYLTKDSISNFQQMAHGGVFDTITRETFDQIDIFLPPLPEQRAIAGVLSSLDDKIDLLHRQNKTLEGMAEALWRKMFVEEADNSWKETSLLEIIDLIGGGTPKTEIAAYWDGSVPWLSAKDITANHKSFIFQTEKNISELGLENSSAILLPKYATIISARGTVGNYCILSSPMAFSQSNYGVLPKIDGCYYFTYLLIAFIVDELKSAAYGSIFDTITTNTFREQKIVLPEKDKILFFEKEIKYYFEKIYNNSLQIRTLSRMRNTLLPKLMSGEVKIKQ